MRQSHPWVMPAFVLSALSFGGAGCGLVSSGTTDDEALSSTSEMAAAEAAGDGSASAPVRGPHLDPAFAVAMDCSAITLDPPAMPATSSTAGEHGGHHGRGPEGGGGGRDGGGHGKGRGMSWVYDANLDGTLDDTEKAALLADLQTGCEARKARLLAAYDTDGDGALSQAESDAAVADLEAQREQRKAAALATYDANGDGTLDETERQAMRDAHRAEILATYDTNGDGALDDTEKLALAEAIKASIRAGEGPGFFHGFHH